jgi:DNA-directed RNA polymerase subunit RPC12/RpoP/uncharacterized protein with PQ loop repeat
MKTICSNCQTPLEWDVVQYGDTIACPSCGATVHLNKPMEGRYPTPPETPEMYLARVRANSCYKPALMAVRIVCSSTIVFCFGAFVWSAYDYFFKESKYSYFNVTLLSPITVAAALMFLSSVLVDIADIKIEQNRKKEKKP